MIERICLQCGLRIKPGSKRKIYCQGHVIVDRMVPVNTGKSSTVIHKVE